MRQGWMAVTGPLDADRVRQCHQGLRCPRQTLLQPQTDLRRYYPSTKLSSRERTFSTITKLASLAILQVRPRIQRWSSSLRGAMCLHRQRHKERRALRKYFRDWKPYSRRTRISAIRYPCIGQHSRGAYWVP